MIFDNTISLGGILNMILIMCGGIGFLISMRSTMSVLTVNISNLTERVGAIEKDIRALNTVTVANAINEEKLNALRGELAGFMNTYMMNHQNLRRDFENRLDKLEKR